MRCFESPAGGRVMVVRLNRGDLLRESIEQAIAEHNISDGCLACGYGTLDNCTLHMINTIEEFPAREDFVSWKGYPLELVSMTGVIADGVPHIHAVVSDKGKATGGHLEYGCSVIYLAEIVIYEHAGMSLTRESSDWGPLELVERQG
ncbi:PPC domain-containing DNA-binding protein [Olsenella phocaeensis]|uniref:PPC domain-containing DNA-binding protein n=1 Tax=Olsenella phocaeensis TaxID=1852385 RepID=UPI0009312223|nr:PPC domain-containing DNA-binding protein [Olsenella phocaeensis]